MPLTFKPSEVTIPAIDATLVKLVRHARHDHPDDVLCGRMHGVSLGEPGRRQLPWLAERVGADVMAVYSSPQRRCLETASVFGRPATPEPALDEINFGLWTGLSFAALNTMASWRAWNADRDAGEAPGGETAAAAQARAVACVAKLRERHGGATVVLVTHGDIIKSIISHHLGLALQAYDRIDIAQASITTLAVRDGSSTVLSMNETAPR